MAPCVRLSSCRWCLLVDRRRNAPVHVRRGHTSRPPSIMPENNSEIPNVDHDTRCSSHDGEPAPFTRMKTDIFRLEMEPPVWRQVRVHHVHPRIFGMCFKRALYFQASHATFLNRYRRISAMSCGANRHPGHQLPRPCTQSQKGCMGLSPPRQGEQVCGSRREFCAMLGDVIHEGYLFAVGECDDPEGHHCFLEV
jgi:hypothetical protein